MSLQGSPATAADGALGDLGDTSTLRTSTKQWLRSFGRSLSNRLRMTGSARGAEKNAARNHACRTSRFRFGGRDCKKVPNGALVLNCAVETDYRGIVSRRESSLGLGRAPGTVGFSTQQVEAPEEIHHEDFNFSRGVFLTELRRSLRRFADHLRHEYGNSSAGATTIESFCRTGHMRSACRLRDGQHARACRRFWAYRGRGNFLFHSRRHGVFHFRGSAAKSSKRRQSNYRSLHWLCERKWAVRDVGKLLHRVHVRPKQWDNHRAEHDRGEHHAVPTDWRRILFRNGRGKVHANWKQHRAGAIGRSAFGRGPIRDCSAKRVSRPLNGKGVRRNWKSGRTQDSPAATAFRSPVQASSHP